MEKKSDKVPTLTDQNLTENNVVRKGGDSGWEETHALYILGATQIQKNCFGKAPHELTWSSRASQRQKQIKNKTTFIHSKTNLQKPCFEWAKTCHKASTASHRRRSTDYWICPPGSRNEVLQGIQKRAPIRQTCYDKATGTSRGRLAGYVTPIGCLLWKNDIATLLIAKKAML